MDILSYFGPSGSSAKADGSSSSSEGDSDSSTSDHEPPAKKLPTEPAKAKKYSKSGKRKYFKSWEKEFNWLEYDEDSEGAFCKTCKQLGKSLQRTGGVWVTKPFTNWKKAVEKMKAHARSDAHIQASEALLSAAKEGSIMQQLQSTGVQERAKNRTAVKSLIRCTHYLAQQHIAHSTNFEKLVNLVVSCGGQDLKTFLESAGRNAVYTSRMAVVEFIEAVGIWVEERILKRLQQATVYSIMADECTDISTVEELSVFCRYEENGLPVERFLEIIPLRKADAETIYISLIDCLNFFRG